MNSLEFYIFNNLRYASILQKSILSYSNIWVSSFVGSNFRLTLSRRGRGWGWTSGWPDSCPGRHPRASAAAAGRQACRQTWQRWAGRTSGLPDLLQTAARCRRRNWRQCLKEIKQNYFKFFAVIKFPPHFISSTNKRPLTTTVTGSN